MQRATTSLFVLLLVAGCTHSRESVLLPKPKEYVPLAVKANSSPVSIRQPSTLTADRGTSLAGASKVAAYRTSKLLPSPTTIDLPNTTPGDTNAENPAATHLASFRFKDPEELPGTSSLSRANVGQPFAKAPATVRHVAALQHAASPPTSADSMDSPELLLPPNEVQLAPSKAANSALPIDLPTALQLTAGRNPQVAFAQERIQEANARLQLAEVMWLPSLRAGVNYNKHEGRIQDVAGNIIDTSRGSFYSGLGAGAVGAGSPAVPGLVMNFHLRDAIFQPEIAGQAVGARRNASRAVTNDLLLETALTYMDLLEAMQVRAIAEQTHDHARQLSDLADDYAKAGQGLESDAARARTELAVREVELRRAEESYRIAAIRLTRLLSRDQSQMLVPQEAALVPIELITIDTSPNELIATGLSNRPELAESRYLVGEAVQRVRREQYAPLVPSVLMGLSYGGYGGGLGGDIENYGDRMDFDAMAFWELRNFGAGERAYRAEACSVLQQTRWRQMQVMDQVAADVAEAHVQVVQRREQIEVAEAAIKTASESHAKNLDRIRDGQGLPIETLQSVQALDQARRLYARVIADYNRAQFRLHRALGWPIESP